jgi:hypothetical protein
MLDHVGRENASSRFALHGTEGWAKAVGSLQVDSKGSKYISVPDP